MGSLNNLTDFDEVKDKDYQENSCPGERTWTMDNNRSMGPTAAPHSGDLQLWGRNLLISTIKHQSGVLQRQQEEDDSVLQRQLLDGDDSVL